MRRSFPPFSDRPGAEIELPDLVGRDFDGRYLIEAELGRGGIGVVYRAESRRLGRRVALKVLREDLAGRSQRRRFEREAKALATLAHPNVVAILDYGVSETMPYLVMELLEGMTLAEALRTNGALALERVRAIMRTLLAGLSYVHSRGLVHRDLKPGNVFIERDLSGGERVKLLDFGMAKFLEPQPGIETSLTRTGDVFGTPAYMPPEQWTGHSVDARSDVYSAGAVLFEMLAGRRPFVGEGQELLRRQLVEAPPLLHEAKPERVACVELEQLFQRALASQARDRHRDAAELEQAFAALPEPFVFEGAFATAERRLAAALARERISDGPAIAGLEGQAAAAEPAAAVEPAVVAALPPPPLPPPIGIPVPVAAAEPAPAARAPSPPPPRPGLLARTFASVAGLLRRLLVASALGVALLSAFVIGGAATLIYILRTPGHAEQREALERALPPLRDAVARSASAAKTVVGEAVSDAKERVSEALPAPVPTPAVPAPPAIAPPAIAPPAIAPPAIAPPAIAPPAAGAGSERVRAVNPWRRPAPRELRAWRTALERGARGDERLATKLRRYNREHAGDPRGHLLLGRMYANRAFWSDAIGQYELALARDPSSRGDPRMLQDLVRAVANEATSARASELVRAVYAAEASAAVERAIAKTKPPEERERLQALARTLVP